METYFRMYASSHLPYTITHFHRYFRRKCSIDPC
jgi:hypothetical protein